MDGVRYRPGMSDQQKEPGEVTERFKAFAQSADTAPSRVLPIALGVIGAAILVVLIVTLIVLSGA